MYLVMRSFSAWVGTYHQRRLVLAFFVLLLHRRQVALRQDHVTPGMGDFPDPAELVEFGESLGGLAVAERLRRLAVIAPPAA